MLACRDYDSTEIALAAHTKFLPPGVDFFYLQNCRGSYDAERTLAAGKRYQKLFPERFHVVEDIPPGPPYQSLKTLIERLSGYDLICKTDDDAFPLTHGWLDSLISTYIQAKQEHGGKLAYATPLVNNNTWGFPEVLKALKLEQDYFDKVSRLHIAGFGSNRQIYPKDEIVRGQDGTIWGNPHIARWLHENSSFAPDRYIAATKALSNTLIPESDRFSINCILFEPKFWSEVDSGGTDDEGMIHKFCAKNSRKIVCNRSIPFVHLSYFSQREELRDLIWEAKRFYSDWLELPFPIGMYTDRSFELDARLRWLETSQQGNSSPNSDPHQLSGRLLAQLLFNKIRRKVFQ